MFDRNWNNNYLGRKERRRDRRTRLKTIRLNERLDRRIVRLVDMLCGGSSLTSIDTRVRKRELTMLRVGVYQKGRGGLTLKTMIVKDADTLLAEPNRSAILAEMRELYDRR